MIDSRDFLAAKRRAETEVMLPPGPKFALTGGLDFNDVSLIWDRLDKVHAKHPDMVLLHGGSPKGAELIAAKWASARRVPQIAFKPDWTKHQKSAPFKRNDAMLAVLPIGVMAFAGTGIQANLADKAKKLGHPSLELRRGRRVSAVPYECLHQAAHAENDNHGPPAQIRILEAKNAFRSRKSQRTVPSPFEYSCYGL
jgi:hypothetical protein